MCRFLIGRASTWAAPVPRALVLGGTREAQAVAAQLLAHDYAVTLAFKGLTARPVVPPGVARRIGGFGGVTGLAAYVRASGTDLLIDATHPFAATMSWNAYRAARLSSTPLFGVQRPAWTHRPGDRWHAVASLPKAVRRLRHARPQRVVLALGGQGAELFRACAQHRFQARVLINSKTALATSRAHRWRRLVLLRVATQRGLADELRGLRQFAADLMIVRNAGGGQDAKLTAARRLSLPVWMIDRPAMPPVPLFSSPSALIAAVAAGMGGR